jgi:hypothetical protein
VDCISPIVNSCVLNQYNIHWVLSDALHSTITMCLKCKEEATNPLAQISLIDDDSAIAFELFFCYQIKMEIFGVLVSFKKYIYI